MCDIKHVDVYPTDFIAEMADLTLEERGVYATAYMLISAAGGPVERDRLKQACSVHGRTFRRVVDRLLALGKLKEEAGKIGEKRAENGRKNAEKRVEKWLKNLDNVGKSTTYADRAPGNARAKGNQEPPLKDSSNLKGEELGRCAPAEGVAPTVTAPVEATVPGTEVAAPVADRPPPPADSDPPAITAEDRAYMAARLETLVTELKGDAARVHTIRDPVAYQQAIEDARWKNWLRLIHGFASERFDGDFRMQAWEAIDIATRAGSRHNTPREVRRLLNNIATLRATEGRVAA